MTMQWNVPLPVSDRNQGEILRAELETEQAQSRVSAIETGIRNEIAAAESQYRTALGLVTSIAKIWSRGLARRETSLNTRTGVGKRRWSGFWTLSEHWREFTVARPAITRGVYEEGIRRADSEP